MGGENSIDRDLETGSKRPPRSGESSRGPAQPVEPDLDLPYIERFVNDYVREQALFLDVEELLVRVTAHTQYQRGLGDSVERPRSADLRAITGRAVQSLLRERAQDTLEGTSEAFLPDECDQFLSSGIGVKASDTRIVALKFNRLPRRVRRAFFAVALRLESMQDLVGTEWESVEDLRRDIHQALLVLMNRGGTSCERE